MDLEVSINKVQHKVPHAWRNANLLQFLRDKLDLSGTKFGCGIGQCGACTVHLDGFAVRSCQVKLTQLKGVEVTTIESLAEGATLDPVQQAWLEHKVAQCGYCQAGQIMSAAAYLKQLKSMPSRQDIKQYMQGNLCRCGTYERVCDAVSSVAEVKFYQPKGV